MPYAIVAITCAMPMSPIMSNGETSKVNDLDRVSPTVILPRQVFGVLCRGAVGVIFGVQKSYTGLSYD